MQDEIRNIIAQSLGIETTDIEDKSLLIEDLGLQAEDLAAIITAINLRYNIEIDIDSAARVKNVEGLFDLISSYVPEELD